jgi:hypothetical protein
MSQTAVAENLELKDPRAMRALAHPVRLSILEVLHANGTARREDEFSDDWRDAATFSSGFIVVSPDELRELNKQFAELLRAYGSDRGDKPDGARRVDVILRALPRVGQ